MRVPSGRSSETAPVGATARPPPPARWTSRTTSVTVPATISTPIATTRNLSARIVPPASVTHEFVPDPAEEGERADRFLARRIGSLSRSRVKALIEAGQAREDGQPLREPATPVRAGRRYALEEPPPAPARPEAQEIPLTILHEDRDLIVIDKPAGLVVHPAPGNQDGTLVNALLAHAGEELEGIGGEARPGIVHRLDKDTSGVMVVAKTQRAHAALSEAFAARDLDREYMALVWGRPSPPAGEIEAAIGRHATDRKRMAVVGRGGARQGKAALTRYGTERGWGLACALLRCKLATGRTHQIRVHLSHAGHPLVGDPVYLRRTPKAAEELPETVRRRLLDFPRQALHAANLGFSHPVTGKLLYFRSEPPADLAGLIAALDGTGVP
ncbi:MAG: RluA family pseudouridine synthase [Acetobacteraceae bacterium]|nr:RluA family pseudouridine synthase [Acetobacteraceae bacterium]